MLILTRKSNESIVVAGSVGPGRTLKVTVLEVRGGEVRLGFDGPEQFTVHRLEVWERIRAGARPQRSFHRPRGAPVNEAADSRDVHGDGALHHIESSKGI
jgi:carbon storage regulator